MNLRVLSILVTFLLLSQFSFGQKIETGRYVYEYGDNVKSIFEILNDSTFYLTENFWSERLIGYGKYSFDKNRLVLNFEELPNDKLISLTKPEYKIIQETFPSKEYITINLSVIDNWEEDPLTGVMVNISDTNNFIIRKYLRTNDSGYAKIKVSQRFLPIILKVFYAGYDPLVIQINEFKNYDLSVTLKGYISYYYKEIEFKKHTIQILDSNSFRLENYFENFDWSTFYKQ